MNNIAYKNMLESNWDNVKGELQTKWGELTDNDINKIDGSYKKLIAKLKKVYGTTALEIEEEIADFFNDSKFAGMKKIAINKINEIKDILSSSLQENFETAKQKTHVAERAAIEYVRENPYKVIGIATLAGFLISQFTKIKR